MSSSSPRHRRSSAAARSSKASETPRAHKGSKAQRVSKRPTGSKADRAFKGDSAFKGDRASKADRVSKAHEVSKAKKVSTARKAPQAHRGSKPQRAAKPKAAATTQKVPKAHEVSKAQKVYRVAAPHKSPAAPRAPQAKNAVAAVAVAPAVVPLSAPPPVVTAPAARVALSCEELLERVVTLIHERRGEDVVALDVRGLADYMDFLVIASGRSERQNRSIADGVMRGLKGLKVRPLARPGPEDGAWICLDFVDVVMHVFDSVTRSHYDLENLWGDAPRFPIAAPPAALPPVPAGEPLAVYEAGAT